MRVDRQAWYGARWVFARHVQRTLAGPSRPGGHDTAFRILLTGLLDINPATRWSIGSALSYGETAGAFRRRRPRPGRAEREIEKLRFASTKRRSNADEGASGAAKRRGSISAMVPATAAGGAGHRRVPAWESTSHETAPVGGMHPATHARTDPRCRSSARRPAGAV